jgi:UDP-glucose 4-epimerase
MARIIVTGAAGFIGSNLSKRLLAEGHQVIGIDNLSFGNTGNLKDCLTSRAFSFIEADIRRCATLDAVHGDVVVHLASQKIPRYTNALVTLDDNAVMTECVVEKCLKDRIKLVFASTSDIYGKNPEVPYHEQSNIVLGPTTVKRWAYALSKIHSEHYIIAQQAEHGLEYTIMRFFGSYGPNQNRTWWGGPQAVFIQNILEGKPLELHGDGCQTRTFTYVDDTVEGIVKCIFKAEASNEIFNIANHANEEIAIKDLAVLIWKLMKGPAGKPDIMYIPYETFGQYEDVRRRVPDIKKIVDRLGFNPGFSLEEGLARTVAWQISRSS